MAVVPSPGVRVAVAESVIRDVGRVSEWSHLWCMKLNPSKTKTMIVSRSGECFMIDRFLGDSFAVLFCQFWSIVLQSGARLPIHTLNYSVKQSVVPGF